MEKRTFLSKCVSSDHLKVEENVHTVRGPRRELCATLASFHMWLLVGFVYRQLSAAGVHTRAASRNGLFLAGTLGSGHKHNASSLLHVLPSVNVDSPVRTSSRVSRQLYQSYANRGGISAFIEVHKTKEEAKTADVAEEGTEREGEEEEKEAEGEKEDEAEENGSEGPAEESSESVREDSEDLEVDKVVGGAIEEENEKTETEKAGDKTAPVKEENAPVQTSNDHSTLQPQREAEVGEKKPSTMTAGEEKQGEPVEQEGAETKSIHQTPHHGTVPSTDVATHKHDENTLGKEDATTERHHEDSPDLQSSSAAVHEHGAAAEHEQFKVQFSFEPDVVIPSEIRPKVQQKKVSDNRGQEWFEFASDEKPQLLKVEANAAATVLHRPRINYA